MTVASGTSTPTSITVVATRMRVSPAAKRAIAASLSAPFIRPCTRSTALPKLASSAAKRSSRRGEIAGLGFLDQRTDPIDAAAFGKRAPDRGHHLVEAIERDGAGVDRQPPGRLLLELGDVHVAEGGQHQRARDRRRGHHQHVDRRTLAGERQALVDAEAVLLVDDGERKIAKIHLVLEQRMGADQEIDLARGEAVENAGPLAAALAPGEDRDRAARQPRRAVRWSCDAGAREFPSAPSARPVRRTRSPRRRRAARRPSCRSRRRPGAGAACAAARRDRH